MSVGTLLRRATLADRYDTIVIGSGIGGLATAVCLAKAGQKVLVLERHYTAGGYTHSFSRKGYEWDVGVHYIGEVHRQGSPMRQIFDYLSDGQLQWAAMEDPYERIYFGDDCYEFRSGKEAWLTQMLVYFPNEGAALERYLGLVRELNRASRNFFVERTLPPLLGKLLRPALTGKFLALANQTTASVLNQLTQNERLKAVLTSQWGDYALPPEDSSFAIHALVVGHYLNGGAYPVGGASAIGRSVEAVLNKYQAQLITSAEVQSILFEGQRAVGVTLSNGRELRAKYIVSAVGMYNTINKLLPDSLAAKQQYQQYLQQLSPSTAHLGLYIGLKGTSAELGLKPGNIWLFPDSNASANLQRYYSQANTEFPFVYLSFPSAKDPSWDQRYPGKSTIDMIVPASPAWFKQWQGSQWQKRGADYQAYKQAATDKLLAILYDKLPQLQGKVHYCELSTPLSTSHFCNYTYGEIYGLNHDPKRFTQLWLRPDTTLKNLFLTGQDILSCGVGGAATAGFLTAIRMLGPIKARHLIGMLMGSGRS